MYSASVLEVATVACFLELQDIIPDLRLKAYLDVEHRVSVHVPQSKSTHPVSVMALPPSTRDQCLVT